MIDDAKARTLRLGLAVLTLICGPAILLSACHGDRPGDLFGRLTPFAATGTLPGLTPIPTVRTPGGTGETINGRVYAWNSDADRDRYSEASWTEITVPRLAGFVPGLEVVERREECSWHDVLAHRVLYLRMRGGIMQCEGYFLEVATDTGIMRVDTETKLRETFAPVESEAEAASFVAVRRTWSRVTIS